MSTTGYGERIIPVVLAKLAADLMGEGLDPQAAAERALATLARVKGVGGPITMDRKGRVGVTWSTPAMAWAARPAGSDDFRSGTSPYAGDGAAYEPSRETSRKPRRR